MRGVTPFPKKADFYIEKSLLKNAAGFGGHLGSQGSTNFMCHWGIIFLCHRGRQFWCYSGINFSCDWGINFHSEKALFKDVAGFGSHLGSTRGHMKVVSNFGHKFHVTIFSY